MKRPWQIWLLFLLCLAIVVPAMGWLTIKALESDRARAEAAAKLEVAYRNTDLARDEAVVQESISSALWRMDWTLTPLIAQETARPYFVYQSFYSAPAGKGGDGPLEQQPSPLLMPSSDYVILHFQLSPDESWTSPQNPVGPFCDMAIECGASPDSIQNSELLLTKLKASTTREELLSELPEKLLPPIEPSQVALASDYRWNYTGQLLNSTDLSVTNDIGVKQLDELQQAANPNTEVPPQQAQAPNPQPFERNANTAQNSFMQSANLAQANQAAEFAQNQYEMDRQQRAVRGGYEWLRRKQGFESYTKKVIAEQRSEAEDSQPIREGVSRPVWIGDKLILARRVKINDQYLIQGCWLNWPKIKSMLLEEIADLLPNADLVPVTPESDAQPGRMLATLPVQLVLPDKMAAATVVTSADQVGAPPIPLQLSPVQVSLILAWSGLLLTTCAVAILLHGVVRLSERRGAFVSAVTHELRTPLTTFRMYAEMLSEGMVTEPVQRQHYVETLRIEADRLSHLVENVLAYARLERGRPGKQREEVSVDRLIEKMESRLRDRATQAEMEFVIEADDATRDVRVRTDPAAVEQVLFNLVDNACKYASAADDKRIHLRAQTSNGAVHIRVCDHGPGISRGEAKRLFHPFSKSVQQAANSAPGVGLGLALCRRMAHDLGGRLELEPGNGDGAAFVLTLPR